MLVIFHYNEVAKTEGFSAAKGFRVKSIYARVDRWAACYQS